MTELPNGNGDGSIEVVPVVVLSQTFPARPSWIPEIRDFVRRCLAESPLNEEGTRGVGETVFRALLDAAGPTGAIQVSFRIFPEHVEVDVLHSNQPPAEVASPGEVGGRAPAVTARPPVAGPRAGSGHAAGHLRRLDVHRAAPRGADPGGRGPAAGGVGQDGGTLGRWRDRAAAPGSAPDPGTVRRASIPLSFRSPGLALRRPVDAPLTRQECLGLASIAGRPPTSVLRCFHGSSYGTLPAGY